MRGRVHPPATQAGSTAGAPVAISSADAEGVPDVRSHRQARRPPVRQGPGRGQPGGAGRHRHLQAAAAARQAAHPAAGGEERVRARRRPANRDPRPMGRHPDGRARSGAAGRHRLRQDVHHGQADRARAAPDADPGAEQDAGGPAVRRDEAVLPGQRRGVFRQLLRLLPAGSLRPAHRHLRGEGQPDQRGDRPHAPRGHAKPAGAQRRGDRRLRLLHLRHRLGRNLLPHGGQAGGGRQDRPRHARPRPGGAAVPAQRHGVPARHVPAARRHGGHLPLALRGPRLARQPVRRRDRVDQRVRPADRRGDGGADGDPRLRQQPLRDAAPDADAGGARHQGGAEGPAGLVRQGRPAAGSRTLAAAHHLRPRDDRDHRVLQVDRELQPLPVRPQTGRAAADAVRIPAGERHADRRRKPRHRAADRRHGARRQRAQIHPGGVRLPPAVLHRQPPAEVRGMGAFPPANRLRQRHARPVGAGAGAGRVRRAGDPPHRAGVSTRCARSARWSTRWTTCWRKSAPPSPPAPARW